MINLFKKKISKKWVALTTLVLGLFWKVSTAKAVGGVIVASGVFLAANWVFTKIFGVSAVDWTLNLVVGGLMTLIINLVGLVLTAMVGILFQAATYTDFITAPVVIGGWVVIRDLSNMFFILILLVIAFATILRIESYSWKKNLPKLLIMAVLINFSKTLCGLAIDFGQVIMLTFLNAFRATGPAYLFTTFGVEKMFNISKIGNENIGDAFSNLTAMLLGLIMLIITCIVIGVFTIILVYRIVMLWILIILSPLAFLAMAIPAGAKYASQWSGEFAKNIITGPVLAFFLWLALVYGSTSDIRVNLGTSTNRDFTKVDATINEMGSNNNLQRFIIAIALLVGGMTMAQQVGGAAASIAGKGLDWAKRSSKFVGKAVGYVPVQYAKKAGYGLGDVALGQLKKLPMVGNLALESQGRLRMHRDYAEEKDTKYMQYMEEQDLDRIIDRQRSRGIMSFLGRGMESKRQMFKRALVQKSKGDEWGMTKEEKMASKTRYLIELGQIAGHSITSSGEDAFRDADLGKLWHEFRNKSVGTIDDEQMRAYYLRGRGNAIGLNGARTGDYYNYRGLPGGDNSEYWRGPDPVTGEARSPNSMVAYTATRMRMNEVHNLHHENFIPRHDAAGNLHYDVLEAIYDEGNGAMRSLAQIRDRGTRQQKVQMKNWMASRLTMEQTSGYTGSTYYRDLWNAYEAANPGTTQDQFLNAAMGNGGVQNLSVRDRLGGSRAIMGETHSAEVASGITGLDRANRGVMAANFSELGLEKVAAKYFDGVDKTEIASRISGSLRENGMAEAAAKAVEDQINKASYLILHNKEAGVSGSEIRTAHAHELMHARVGANFNQDELKGIWNSMDENSKNDARKQISAKWGGKMSEEAIMNEYFTEGLTAKTRWGKGAVSSLNKTAESGLDGLLKAKGSNIKSFTSNVIKTRPTSDDVSQSIANNVDGSLKETLDELIGTLKDVGNGFSSIENFSSNLNNLQRSIERNRTSLDKNVKGYKEVTDKLNNLANKTT